jgi:hypothetical protein
MDFAPRILRWTTWPARALYSRPGGWAPPDSRALEHEERAEPCPDDRGARYETFGGKERQHLLRVAMNLAVMLMVIARGAQLPKNFLF